MNGFLSVSYMRGSASPVQDDGNINEYGARIDLLYDVEIGEGHTVFKGWIDPGSGLNLDLMVYLPRYQTEGHELVGYLRSGSKVLEKFEGGRNFVRSEKHYGQVRTEPV